MPFYRVEFIKDWITGRWGFTDRVFHDLKGKETPAHHLDSAWLVNYTGTPDKLGELLSRMLNIQSHDFRDMGTIFEIIPLKDGNPKPPEPQAPKRKRHVTWRSPQRTPTTP